MTVVEFQCVASEIQYFFFHKSLFEGLDILEDLFSEEDQVEFSKYPIFYVL